MKRIILAGLLGGLALFAWEFVAHMLFPLGEAGVKGLANEQAIMTAVKDNIKDPGFYIFPAPEDRPGMTGEQKRQAMDRMAQRWRTGPAGIMVVHPGGFDSLASTQLLTQFGSDIVTMLIAAMVLSLVAAGYGQRVLLTGLMGLLPGFQSEVPLWNWYGFPAAYLLAQVTVHLVGFLVAGLVLAKMVKPPAKTAAAGAPVLTAS
jgi:hypothetical protein